MSRKQSALGFFKWFPFLVPNWKHGDFSPVLFEILELKHTSVGASYDCVPLECLTDTLVPTEPEQLISYSQVSLLCCWLLHSFCLWVSALLRHNTLLLSICLSLLGGSVLPFAHILLTTPKIVIDFPVCLAFHLVLGWSGDFQISTCGTKSWELPQNFEKW